MVRNFEYKLNLSIILETRYLNPLGEKDRMKSSMPLPMVPNMATSGQDAQPPVSNFMVPPPLVAQPTSNPQNLGGPQHSQVSLQF